MSSVNAYEFEFQGCALALLPTGALWWPAQGLLCVSDLHLGKAERQARLGGHLLPPYETQDTLIRLEKDIIQTCADKVVCLGDSFDDLTAASQLPEAEHLWLDRLMAGREWIWIEGNHDPGPIQLGGTHLAELHHRPLTFRHIADLSNTAEVTGHYHPKARISLRGRHLSRPCMLIDRDRLILPAYGTYTGGLHAHDVVLGKLMRRDARAVLLGTPPCPIPMPRKSHGDDVTF